MLDQSVAVVVVLLPMIGPMNFFGELRAAAAKQERQQRQHEQRPTYATLRESRRATRRANQEDSSSPDSEADHLLRECGIDVEKTKEEKKRKLDEQMAKEKSKAAKLLPKIEFDRGKVRAENILPKVIHGSVAIEFYREQAKAAKEKEKEEAKEKAAKASGAGSSNDDPLLDLYNVGESQVLDCDDSQVPEWD